MHLSLPTLSPVFSPNHIFPNPRTVISLSAGPRHPTPHPHANCRAFLNSLPASWCFLLQTNLNTPAMSLKPWCARVTPQLRHLQWLPTAHLLNLVSSLPFNHSPKHPPSGWFYSRYISWPCRRDSAVLRADCPEIRLGPRGWGGGCSSESAAPLDRHLGSELTLLRGMLPNRMREAESLRGDTLLGPTTSFMQKHEPFTPLYKALLMS